MGLPPPLPQTRKRTYLLFVGLGVALSIAAILASRSFVRSFSIPTAGMAPAIEKGDVIIAERFSYLRRSLQRGDILVFRAGGVDLPVTMRAGDFYVKRLVGLPGETLAIVDGALLVNGVRTPIWNHAGEIRYHNLSSSRYLTNEHATMKVPAGQYFVLGDNSLRNMDSRFFGCIPAKSVFGRAVWRCAPANRTGPID